MNNRICISYEKFFDYPIIFNPKFKEKLIYYKKYFIYSNDLNIENSLGIKVFSNKFFFKLLQVNKQNKNNNKISFYENYYNIYEIKNLFQLGKIEPNLEETIKTINEELIQRNIEIINVNENKIKLIFKNYNDSFIELLKIELYQAIKNHLIFINNNNISTTNINPNFISKNMIINNSLSIFEIYYPFEYQDEIFIIYQNNNNLNLEIKSILNKKQIASLNTISGKVTVIKHFFNPKNSYDYLCVSDINKIIHVYNLSLNYNLLYKIKTYYSFNIFCCLLFFDDKNNNNYLISSTYGKNKDDYTKVFTLEDGAFIKNYPMTNNNSTISLLCWYHKILKCNYIIELCSEKIFIYQMITNGYYMEYNVVDNDFLHGFILETKEKKDYLYCSTYDNNIFVFDLYKKSLNRRINVWNIVEKKCKINDMIKWSNNYIIIINSSNNCLDIIDVKQNKIINCIKEIKNIHISNIKKIIHPIYGESLLSSSDNSTISLWF